MMKGELDFQGVLAALIKSPGNSLYGYYAMFIFTITILVTHVRSEPLAFVRWT